MRKKKATLGDRLIESAKEAVSIARGEMKSPRVTKRSKSARTSEVSEPPLYDAMKVRKLREKLNMSQTVFARTLNASDATVRAWEQGKRIPDGPSLRLLEVADKHPQVFASVVRERQPEANSSVIERDSARRLSRLGGSDPEAKGPRRRRGTPR